MSLVDEIEVWWAETTRLPTAPDEFLRELSDGERVRASRFVQAVDRDRFVLAHGILRRILGTRLSKDPAVLEFKTNDFGKPGLASSMGAPVSFNLSHAAGVVVVAVGPRPRIGIDVEQIRTNLDFLGVAKGVFSEDEFLRLESLATSERLGAFFRCWTRKEAFMKALGEGFSRPPGSFSVNFEAGQSPRILHDDHDPSAPNRWNLAEVCLRDDYVCAVAWDGEPARVKVRPWTG